MELVVRADVRCRLRDVALLGVRHVYRRDWHAAAAFQRARPVEFIDQEILQRRQQKGAKPAPGRRGASDVALVEQACKERLREILGIFWPSNRVA